MTTIHIAIVIVLLFYLIFLFNSRSHENAGLNGMWKGSTEFVNSSGLTNMLFYIDSSTCHGYLLATNTNGIILNHSVEFNFGTSWTINPMIRSHIRYDTKIKFNDETPDYFSERQTIHYYPQHKKLVFLDKEGTVTAELYIDNELSDFDSIGPENEMQNMDEYDERTQYEDL